MNPINWSGLILALLAGLLIRLFFIFSSHYISSDGCQYVSIGQNWITEGEYKSNGAQFPDIIQPPLFPLTTGLFSWYLSAELAGKCAALLAGLLLIALVYGFVRFISSNTYLAILAAWAAALHPALVSIASQAATESLYIMLIFAGFSLGWLALGRKKEFYLASLSIIWFLAFLTRPEALAFFIMYLLLLSVYLILRRVRFRGLIFYLAPFVLGLLALSQINYENLGYHTIAPKLSFVRSHTQLFRYWEAMDRKTGDDFAEDIEAFRYRFSLSKTKPVLAANALFLRDSTAENEFKVPEHQVSGSRLWGFVAYVLENVRRISWKLTRGVALPPFFVLIALPGLLYFRRRHFRLIVYSLLMIAPGFSFLLSHVEERFLFITAPFLTLLTAWGLYQVYSLLKAWPALRSRRVQTLLAVLILFGSSLPVYAELHKKFAEDEYYYDAGQWLQQRLPANAVVSATVPQAVFHAGLNYSVLPFAYAEPLLLYLHSHGINYILLEEKDRRRRPQLKAVFNGREPFSIIEQFQADSQKFYLIHINEGVPGDAGKNAAN